MATQFGQYSPIVPSNTAWQESIQFTDQNGLPIDLTGLKVQSQIRQVLPSAVLGVPSSPPLFELTSAGFYSSPVAWPSYAGWSIPLPTSGTLVLNVPRDTFLPILNPTNVKVKYVWDVVLVAADGTRQPVVSGKPVFIPGATF